MSEVEVVDDEPKQVIVDIKLGAEKLAVRFSASCTTPASDISHLVGRRYGGDGRMQTWEWVSGTTEDNGDTFTDIMRGQTICYAEEPMVLTALMVESWLVNHGKNWALATTDAERDLSGRVLRNLDAPAQIEA